MGRKKINKVLFTKENQEGERKSMKQLTSGFNELQAKRHADRSIENENELEDFEKLLEKSVTLTI